MSKVVTIFGSARALGNDEEYEQALVLGKLLAGAGFTICNGGYGGIMEASAKGAKSIGGKTIGVTVETFSRIPNKFIDKLIVEADLLSRLQKLISLGDAYVVCKGATGTLAELAFVWELINKGLMEEKPIIILGNFWSSIVETLKNELAWEGLENCTKYVTQLTTPEDCLQLLLKKLLNLNKPG
jgi:uncharacterized protein (TIGR00730 family)